MLIVSVLILESVFVTHVHLLVFWASGWLSLMSSQQCIIVLCCLVILGLLTVNSFIHSFKGAHCAIILFVCTAAYSIFKSRGHYRYIQL